MLLPFDASDILRPSERKPLCPMVIASPVDDPDGVGAPVVGSAFPTSRAERTAPITRAKIYANGSACEVTRTLKCGELPRGRHTLHVRNILHTASVSMGGRTIREAFAPQIRVVDSGGMDARILCVRITEEDSPGSRDTGDDALEVLSGRKLVEAHAALDAIALCKQIMLDVLPKVHAKRVDNGADDVWEMFSETEGVIKALSDKSVQANSAVADIRKSIDDVNRATTTHGLHTTHTQVFTVEIDLEVSTPTPTSTATSTPTPTSTSTQDESIDERAGAGAGAGTSTVIRASLSPEPSIVLEIGALVPGVSWEPVYEMQLDDKGENGHLAFKAKIVNNSGQALFRVPVCLSTTDTPAANVHRTFRVPLPLVVGKRRATNKNKNKCMHGVPENALHLPDVKLGAKFGGSKPSALRAARTRLENTYRATRDIDHFADMCDAEQRADPSLEEACDGDDGADEFVCIDPEELAGPSPNTSASEQGADTDTPDTDEGAAAMETEAPNAGKTAVREMWTGHDYEPACPLTCTPLPGSGDLGNNSRAAHVTMTLDTLALSGCLSYVAAPESDTSVYIKWRGTAPESVQLPGGAVDVFVGTHKVCTGVLNLARPGEEIGVLVGCARNVRIEHVRERTEQTFAPHAPASKDMDVVHKFRAQTVVTNHTGRAVPLVLLYSLPRSGAEGIRVSLEAPTIGAARIPKCVDILSVDSPAINTDGLVAVPVHLAPGERRQVPFEYTVRQPARDAERDSGDADASGQAPGPTAWFPFEMKRQVVDPSTRVLVSQRALNVNIV